VEVHDHEMDVLYIVDGTATFVLRRKDRRRQEFEAGQWLGTDITAAPRRSS
jgi:cupin superfamily acireductone dioxygenase involved in methionine salvage